MNIPKWLHEVIYEKKYRLLKHVLFWLFIYSDETLSFTGLTEPLYVPWYYVIASLLLDMFLVYFNIYYLIPKFFLKGKLMTYAFITLVMLFAVVSINYVIYNKNPYLTEIEDEFVQEESDFSTSNEEYLEEDYYEDEMGFMGYFFASIVTNAGMLFMAVAMKLIEESYISSRKIQELKEVNLRTELAYLQTQVNPHFLFNTLNNMYVMSQKKDENVPETIMQLSDLLRYQLYECNSDTVPLKNEITYLKNYIELEQLRRQNLKINLDVKGNPLLVKIRPLIFLPFIENAFKYSKTGEKDFIDIVFDAHKEKLLFRCINNKGTLESRDVGGIGLRNATRRLELAYPDNHKLKIKDLNNTFEVIVQIDLA